MKIERNRGKKGKFGWGLLCSLLLIALAQSASAEIIPSDRRVTWQGNVGVSGDIPNRTIIYTTLSSTGNDDTNSIQTAINNCPSGQVVKLNAGTFKITSLSMKSNVTLRGSGINATTLKGTGTSSYYIISFYNNSGTFGTSYNLASGYTKGSTTITTSSSHGWSAGDVILIDQLNNPTGDPPVTNVGTDGTCTWCSRANGGRCLGQVVKVISPTSGTSATLEIPLYWTFSAGLTPQGTKINIGASNAGVEDLKIDNSTSWNGNQNNDGTVYFYGASNCWLLRVEVYGVYKTGIYLGPTYRNTVRSCTVHLPYQYTSSYGYGLWMTWASSANLVEDCIFYDLANGPIYNGPMSGNVISYNYVTLMKSTTYPQSVRMGIVAHGGHSMMNLFEGNYVDGPTILADCYWGSSSHNTYLRNREFFDSTKTAETYDVGVYTQQRYYNIVGNVLGRVGVETKYEGTTPYGDKSIYMLDYQGSNGQSEVTLLRHGNWDSVTNGIVWDTGISDHVIPNSYYLASKPSFFGSCPWPPIGTDLNPMVGTLPAKARYEGSSNCQGDSGPQAPQNLKIIP